MSEPAPERAPRPAWRARIAHPALALGAGFLVAVSLPPWGWWPLAVVGVVLFEIALGELPSRRRRALLGGLFGAGWMFMGMGWMVQLTVPGYLIAGAAFSSLHAVAAVAAPVGAWRVIGRPAAHTLVEALRFSFPFGGVPLASLGISQVAGPLADVARVGGVVLLTWLVFQLGFALAGPAPAVPAFARRSRPTAVGSPLGTLGLLGVVAVVVLAALAPTGSATGETLTVAAVQGGGPQGTRATDESAREVTRRHLAATRALPRDLALDLVLWPENTVDVAEFATSTQLVEIAGEAARLGVPISVGVTEDTADRSRFVNAQVVVTPDGEVISRYEKVRRVPFGEYVPLRTMLEAIGAPIDRIGRDAVAGTGPAYVDLADGTRLAVAISWEIFFGGRVRDGVELGGEAVINPTNGASYTGTIVQTQQVASSRLRAIESGRWVVQAAPTGFTAVVDHDGTVRDRTAVSEQRVIIDEIELRTGFTWYTRLGDAPFIVLAAALLALAWWGAPRRARAAAPGVLSPPRAAA